MNTNNNYYFIHILFNMGTVDVDNLLYYDNSSDFVTVLNLKMQEINDSLYRNYPDAYINTTHHVISDNGVGINLNPDKKTNNPYIIEYSSEEAWQNIKTQMNESKENSTCGKSETDKLQNCLKLFNDFLTNITTNVQNKNSDTFDVTLQAGNLNQFVPYFIDFLLYKANSDNDFVSEKLQPYKESLKSFQRWIKSKSFPQNNFQVEQFLELIHYYNSLQELTDQWVNYQVN